MKIIYQSLFTLGITFLLCNITLGQAPNMGSDSSFALFTSAGAFGNIGSTTIWGDVGTHVGAYTGGQIVFGSVHVEDSFSANAALDLQTAYTFMVGLTCDSTIVSPLGGGLVLKPGRVYCLTSATDLNGSLILDAEGNSNGIFIIKINGALSTGINSKVILLNSASPCNVYWQVGGAVNLGINSTFKGTILADGAINLLDSAFLEGRALTRAGAISLNNNKVLGCDASMVALPMELISFTAQPLAYSMELNWTMASEINNDYFTIQHTNGLDSFSELLRIPGNGNSQITQHYRVVDEQPFLGENYYRLQQTDFDGKSKYSDIIVVNFKNSIHYNFYPNPFNTTLSVFIDDPLQITNIFELKIYTMLGEEMMNAKLTDGATILETGNLISGMYFYKIICNFETMQTGLLISIQ